MSGELTAEQRAVVERPFASRTFVVAGPGTGKTFALVHRAAALLDESASDRGKQVLVFSFTRAVVAEISRRLRYHPAAESLAPSTLDRFAARTVLTADGRLPPGGYEASIVRAIEVLEGDPDVGSDMHLIIDEAQDLTGGRLELVGALLRRASGFTILGDPAQAIYGFAAGETQDPLASLQRGFPTAPVLRLTKDLRVRREAGRLAAFAREPLVGDPATPLFSDLAAVLRDAPRLSVGELATVLRRADEQTAVLCRTGYDVLEVSQRLVDRRVGHVVRSALDDRLPPAWVARAFGHCEEQVIGRTAFGTVLPDADPEWHDTAWEALRHIAPGEEADEVRLWQLRERLGQDCSVDLPEQGQPSLPMISTVHRAKGLEFDRVIVQEPDPVGDATSAAGEGRVLFVAMTRARDETLMLGRERVPFRWRKLRGRWVGVPWRGGRALRFEVRSGDVDRSLPTVDDEELAASQEQLAERTRPGDPLIARRHGDGSYCIVHDGVPIGRLGRDAEVDLAVVNAAAPELTGFHVRGVSSATGEPRLTEALGLGPGGFWLVPVIAGLAVPNWTGSAAAALTEEQD